MSLDSYREELEEIGESLESRFSRHRAHQIKIALDNVMPFILLLIGFVIVFEFFLSVTPAMEVWINRANWALIAYFGARLIVSFRLSSNHDQFIDDHWLDILLVIPVFSIMKGARLGALAPAIEEMPVFERGVLWWTRFEPTAKNAAKLTRITRIIKRSV